VAPEVTTGRVVVVVGGIVVGGRVVDVVAESAGASAELGLTAVVVVVGDTVVEVVEDGVVDGGISVTDDFADPGCSRATKAPMTTVAPVAMTIAVEVRRRILVWARSGEIDRRGRRCVLAERSNGPRSILDSRQPGVTAVVAAADGRRITIERRPDAKMTSAGNGRHPLVIHDG
jgi:hypothetical protein